jgi:glycosyltransferase involved in cell wall biosynthesis
MPVFNGGGLFAGALESIRRQSWRNTEIIISDNGSTDGAAASAYAGAADDSRIRYFRHDMTLPALQNYRFVFEQARGEYFFWAPHDDWWDTAFIENAVRALDKRPTASLVMGTAHYIGREGRELWNDQPPYHLDSEIAHDRIRYYLTHPVTDMLYYGVFRRDALARAEWIDSTCPEKSIIMAALARGPVVDGPGMDYFNRLSFKSKEEVAAVFSLPSYSFRFQWRTFRGIVRAMRRGVSAWDFARLLPVLIVKQNWHKQLVKDLLGEMGLLQDAKRK